MILHVRFISENRGAATRYRIHHHAEQARAAGCATEVLPLATAAGKLADLRRLCALDGVDLLYLHRLRLTTYTLPLLLAARARRIPVVFDSDDLVWDAAERQYNQLDTHYDAGTVQALLAETRRTRLLMRLADAFVFATPYLAALAQQQFRQPAHVHLNALGDELCALSATAQPRALDGQVLIGYFSGTAHVHNDDLARVAKALATTLDRFARCQIVLYGGVALPAELACFGERVTRRDMVRWQELPAQIARVDINIAPLVDNPQRRAKSAVKYLEAAAVGVPTLASTLDPYAIIHDGVTGMLADDTHGWAQRLALLVTNRDLRLRLAAAARADVLTNHTTAARSARFGRLVRGIM